ncbi:hypothetical protein ACLBXJ_22145 [Methylobacterium mesophilicum]
MSEILLDGPESERVRNDRTLKRIAVTLGISETALLDCCAAEPNFDETTELLRVWDRLKHAADRSNLLAFARSLAAQD